MSDAVLGDIASTTSTLSELLADSEGQWPTEFSITLAQQLKGKVASAGVIADEASHLLSLIQRACDQVISCDRTNPLVLNAFQSATTRASHYTVEKLKRRGKAPPPPPISAEQFLSQRLPSADQVKRLSERLEALRSFHQGSASALFLTDVESTDLRDLIVKLDAGLPNGATKIDIARKHFGGNSKKAKSALSSIDRLVRDNRIRKPGGGSAEAR